MIELEHYGVPFSSHRRRQDLPARLRRPVAGLRQGRPGLPLRVRRGPHWTRDPAHPLRAGAASTTPSSSSSTLRSTSSWTTRARASASSPCAWRTELAPPLQVARTRCSRRAATDARASPRRPRTRAPATVTRWRRARACPMQDQEFVQFHPDRHLRRRAASSPRARAARAVSSATREGERFMERYAPSAKDLASRDVVSRSMTLEIIARDAASAPKRTTSTSTSTTCPPSSSPSGCRASRRPPPSSPVWTSPRSPSP